MKTAHVLVKYDDKYSLEELKGINEVKEVRHTFGTYNAVIKLEAESVYKIKKIMTEKIRYRKGILNTLTLVTA